MFETIYYLVQSVLGMIVLVVMVITIIAILQTIFGKDKE